MTFVFFARCYVFFVHRSNSINKMFPEIDEAYDSTTLTFCTLFHFLFGCCKYFSKVEIRRSYQCCPLIHFSFYRVEWNCSSILNYFIWFAEKSQLLRMSLFGFRFPYYLNKIRRLALLSLTDCLIGLVIDLILALEQRDDIRLHENVWFT